MKKMDKKCLEFLTRKLAADHDETEDEFYAQNKDAADLLEEHEFLFGRDGLARFRTELWKNWNTNPYQPLLTACLNKRKAFHFLTACRARRNTQSSK